MVVVPITARRLFDNILSIVREEKFSERNLIDIMKVVEDQPKGQYQLQEEQQPLHS